MNAAPASADRAAERAVRCRILDRHDLAPHLFTFRTERPAGLSFLPGQFVRLGIAGEDGVMVWRAYSIASPPADETLAFYTIVVPDGPFTRPLARLALHDRLAIDPTIYGFLTTDRFVGGRHLWLLATGTGIAPFRSMLADPAVWSRFEEIVLVHSVRAAAELVYRDELMAWAKANRGARLRYLPTITGATPTNRITHLLQNGRLETSAGLSLAPGDTRLMIAGNPSMIKDVRALLNARGFAPVRRETPGHYIAENFW